MYHGTFRPSAVNGCCARSSRPGIARERGVGAARRRRLVRVPEAVVAIGRARRGSRRSPATPVYWRAATAALSAATVSGVAPAHGLAALIGLPENGSTVPPSSTVLNQRVSLSCWLSARSPVVSTNPSFARLPLPSLTVARAVGVDVAHHAGRRPAARAPPAAATSDELAARARSRKSTRAGDISSAICGSVSCAKNASERRLRTRAARAGAPAPRRTT